MGISVDSFGQLRKEKVSDQHYMDSVCYTCGIGKYTVSFLRVYPITVQLWDHEMLQLPYHERAPLEKNPLCHHQTIVERPVRSRRCRVVLFQADWGWGEWLMWAKHDYQSREGHAAWKNGRRKSELRDRVDAYYWGANDDAVPAFALISFEKACDYFQN